MGKGMDRGHRRLRHLYICQIYGFIPVHIGNPYIPPVIAGGKGFDQHFAGFAAGIHYFFQGPAFVVADAPHHIFVKSELHRNRPACYKFFIKCAEAGFKFLVYPGKGSNFLSFLLHFHV